MKPMLRKLFCILSFTLASFISGELFAQSCIVTTVMGSDYVPGYSGDGGPATAARMRYISYVAADTLGNFYVTDYQNNNIRKVNSNGIISTFAGIGIQAYGFEGVPATASPLFQPMGIAVDDIGNVYVAELNRIRKINPAGIITTIAGVGPCGSGGDGGPATAAYLCHPWQIAVDKNRSVFIADYFNYKVRKIDSNGIITTIGGNGYIGSTGDGGPATAAAIDKPAGIAVDNWGNVYVSEQDGAHIRKINTAGIISTVAGNGDWSSYGDGGPATAAAIEMPIGLATDSRGNLYISGQYASSIRKVDLAGIITRFAGGGSGGEGVPATATHLAQPWGLAFDGCSSLYYVEFNLLRVRKINNIFDLHAPTFSFGNYLFDTVCTSASSSLDAKFALTSADPAIRFQWDIIDAPRHGSISTVSYSAVGTGGPLAPSGFNYTATLGYAGLDTIKVLAANCQAFDTATLFLKIVPEPDAGSISGVDTMCSGSSYGFHDDSFDGIWSVANSVATVSSTGVVTAAGLGIDTIYYTTTNICGTATTSRQVVVSFCPDEVTTFEQTRATLSVYPNPNNGEFFVKISGGLQPTDIVVRDVLGKKITTLVALPNQDISVTTNLASGIYFVTTPALGKSVKVIVR